MPVLALWAADGGIAGAVAPLGLAAAAGTALVVDLDPGGPSYPGPSSLASLVLEGPRRADLSPQRRGLAVLRNGGIDPGGAAEVLAALAGGWPAVVLRLGPAQGDDQRSPAPVVPLRSLLPGILAPPARPGRPAVYQRAGYRQPPPGPGPVLPVPRRDTVVALLSGTLPPPDRWTRAWGEVWRYPWA